MRRAALTLTTLTFLLSTGCRQTPPKTPAAPASPFDGMSLAEMNARYDKLRAINLNDCLYGTPEHVRANQQMCVKERADMAPLGNAIVAREQQEAQQRNH
jgi:hypothetical protein